MARLFEFTPKTDPQLVAQLLTPDIVENLYNKASNTRPEMLNKLVEKGKQIDSEAAVLQIYGDETKDSGRLDGLDSWGEALVDSWGWALVGKWKEKWVGR